MSTRRPTHVKKWAGPDCDSFIMAHSPTKNNLKIKKLIFLNKKLLRAGPSWPDGSRTKSQHTLRVNVGLVQPKLLQLYLSYEIYITNNLYFIFHTCFVCLIHNFWEIISCIIFYFKQIGKSLKQANNFLNKKIYCLSQERIGIVPMSVYKFFS